MASIPKTQAPLSPIRNLEKRLEGAHQTGPGQGRALCPAHNDKTPSLDYKETDDGTLLIICRSGCTALEVVHAVGLEMRDLFPQNAGDRSSLPSRQRWDYRALIRALRVESTLVLESARQIETYGHLSESDTARLRQAVHRIARLSEAAQ